MSERSAAPAASTLHPAVALRLAATGLERSPGTSLLAVAILALGLAAPSVFFSLLVGAIRPLPVPEGDRVVRVDVVQPAASGGPIAILSADFSALSRPAGLESLGAFRLFEGTLIDPGQAATRVAGAALTPEVLQLLRVTPERGRIPTATEAETTLLVSHSLWQESYGGDPAAIGRTVEVDGRPRTIVGVMPEGFGFPFRQNAWVVMRPDPASGEPVALVGRLTSGGSEERVASELAGRWAALDAGRVAERSGGVVEVRNFTAGRGEGGEGVAFLGLVLIALCLLLIACANVANLLLVRATERVRALGIQSALGAGRGQIGLQLFLEALLIAAAGGVVGLVLADIGVTAIQNALAAEHFGYHWMRMSIDGRVMAFTGVLVGATSIVAGMLPVVRVNRIDVQRVLKEESSGSAMGGGGVWGRTFVTAQLALSCGALVAAGLTGRAMNQARGFGEELDAEGVLMATVALEASDPEARSVLIDAVTRSAAAVPGARSAAVAAGAPGFREPWGGFEMDGIAVERASDRERINWNAVTPGYFDVMGLSVLEGRLLSDRDRADAAPVAVVNESFVRRFSPDRPAVGRTVRFPGVEGADDWSTIVGVVEDARVAEGERIRHERVYLPMVRAGGEAGMVLLRSGGDAAALAPALRSALAEVDPGMAVWSVRTLADGLDFMIRVPRAMGALALGGGAAGLMVAAVGLYGLLAFRVRRRRRELGVRLALGADGGRLARETVEFALRQLLPAIVVGLALAWLAAPLLAVALLGLNPHSPSTFAAVAIAFLAVGLVAAGVPAWRAARTDPARVLRSG